MARNTPTRSRATLPTKRAPLTRERVMACALDIADKDSLTALSMREIGARLGVEAMSLYKHVAGKDDILDGLVDLVLSEVALPSERAPWREALRKRALSARDVLLKHPWAAALIEQRTEPRAARLKLHDATVGVLLRAGFDGTHAYLAYVTLDAYIYGFVLQEVSWPDAPAMRAAAIAAVQPSIPANIYPHLAVLMPAVQKRAIARAKVTTAPAAFYQPDFEFGLELILDGLARAPKSARKVTKRKKKATAARREK